MEMTVKEMQDGIIARQQKMLDGHFRRMDQRTKTAGIQGQKPMQEHLKLEQCQLEPSTHDHIRSATTWMYWVRDVSSLKRAGMAKADDAGAKIANRKANAQQAKECVPKFPHKNWKQNEDRDADQNANVQQKEYVSEFPRRSRGHNIAIDHH